jgi:acyl-CoA synthetase (AMP-forming)/AMP-acid ligase II
MTPEELERTGCSTLLDILDWRAAETPERLAYLWLDVHGEEVGRLSYRDLELAAKRLAFQLRAVHGLDEGDRALILTEPGLSFLVSYFGCQYAKVIAVTCATPHKSRPMTKVLSIIQNCVPKIAITDPALLPQLTKQFASDPLSASIPVHAFDCSDGPHLTPDRRSTPDDIAFLQYTSGSTSDPKGVVLTHGNLMANERMIRVAMEHDETSTFVGWTPLHHDQGLIGNVLQPLYIGAPSVLMAPTTFIQRPLSWLQAISKYRAKTSGGPDFAFGLCARRAKPEILSTLDLSSWSVAYNGADTVYRETIELFSKTFAPCGFRREAFFNCYGLAEASLFVAGGPKSLEPTYQPVERQSLGVGQRCRAEDGRENAWIVACGVPAENERVVIVDPATCLPVGREQVGELWVSGANVARRYWNNEITTRTLHAKLAGLGELEVEQDEAESMLADHFLRTGDLGFLRSDGQLFITGRLKDLIIIEGRNVYPQDLEYTVQRASPAFVAGGGAAGVYHDQQVQRVAFVQEVHGTESEERLTMLIRRVIAEEHDVTVHTVVLVRKGTLPKTSSGKMQRALVLRQLASGELVRFHGMAAAPHVPGAARSTEGTLQQ